MKYFVYAVLAFIAALLFLPASGTTQIRNLPLLLFTLSVILLFMFVRFFKYVLLVVKTKKQIKKIGIQKIKIKFFPWDSFFHGHYSIIFSHENKTAQSILLSKKRKYQRYHFDSINKLEFYRSNRVVFNSIKAKGATICNSNIYVFDFATFCQKIVTACECYIIGTTHLRTKFNIFGQKTVVPYITHQTSVLYKGQQFLTELL